MSLISDALKTAQRERTGRAQSGKEPQPLLDGFFPYVASSPERSRSRLAPILGISLGAIALLGGAWFLLPVLTGSGAGERKSPAVLSPPPVAQAPVAQDSAPPATDSQSVATTEPTAQTPVGSEPESRPPAPLRRAGSGNVGVAARAVDPQSTRTDTSTVRDRQVEPVAPRSEPTSSRVDYEAQATTLFNAGDFAGARDRFLLAIRFAPTARAWTNYGVTLQKLGDLGGAATAYQSAIGVDANYLEAWLYQGRLAVESGDVARAIPLFHRARAINPRHSEVNVELARLESEAKNWTETRRFAEDAVRGDLSNARAHWYLAIATDQLKDLEVAAREYAAYLQTVGAAERDQALFVGYARQRLAQLRGRPE